MYHGYNDAFFFFFKGGALGLYRIFAAITFLKAAWVLLIFEMSINFDTINFFSVLLPFFVIFYDQNLNLVKGRQEIPILYKLKINLILFYWALMVIVKYQYFQGDLKTEEEKAFDIK